MFLKLFIFILQITNIFTFKHREPMAERSWNRGCKRNSIALNDCNWCLCDTKETYHCKTRLCEEVDMFGHFKDAIQDIDVGMEGHGSWRSLPTPCTPSVYYRREDVLCLCDEDGNWPNPVCRDLFRVIHTVEGVYQKIATNHTCSPRKLYLVGCNVCFCSLSGNLDPKLCTKYECKDDDPALQQNQPIANSLFKVHGQEASEVYASCDPNYRYDLGCKSCICLKNNRLLCNNCTESQLALDRLNSVIRKRIGPKPKPNKPKPEKPKPQKPTPEKPKPQKPTPEKPKPKLDDDIVLGLCNGRIINENFEVGCNICLCDKNARFYCTTRVCISIEVEIHKLKLPHVNTSKKILPPKVKSVERPLLDDMCTPGTKYNKECNICICIKVQNVKVFDCSLKKCSKDKTPIELQQNDCVLGRVYKMDCQICYCYTIEEVKHQICQYNPDCRKKRIPNSSLLGYCQPLHYFKKDCNTCRCLSDGKTAECSNKYCAQRSSEPLSVDIIPVQMKKSETCPKGYYYKLECNLCFCLRNGNAICTTADCSEAESI